MTESDERIAKLQRLLDRVLTRGEEVAGAPIETALPEMGGGASTDEAGDGSERETPIRTPIDPLLLAKAVGSSKEHVPARAPVEERASEPGERTTSGLGEAEPRGGAGSSDDVRRTALDAPIPLASRARLVITDSTEPEPSDELSEDDIVPESDATGVPVLLVRRSTPLHSPEPVSEQLEAAPDRTSASEPPPSFDKLGRGDELVDELAPTEERSGEVSDEATEERDDAPVSSRRPIATDSISEQLAEEEFAPRLTPPPASGRQIAAPLLEVEEPASSRRTSSPPPAEPDVVLPELDVHPGAPRVAVFTGVSAVPRPATFGQLIDDALEL